MADEPVCIDRMMLRVAGLSSDEARRLGQDVVERVADRVESGKSEKFLGAVRSKVTMALDTTDRDPLAKAVARRILKGIR